MGYKDMTFCSSDCTNKTCFRFFGDDQRERAIAWWGAKGAPVAFSDFSKRCEDYKNEIHISKD